MIIVEAEMDRMGNILVIPVSMKMRKLFSYHMEDMGQAADSSVFFQEGMGAEEFMDDLSDRQRRELEGGWPIRFKVDPWVYGHWLGWDAHTLFE